MKKETVAEKSIGKLESQIEELGRNAGDKKRPKATTAKLKQLKNELQKAYIESKKELMSCESTNYGSLAFLKSTNGFHKLFGHSLLFYVSDVAPKLELTANVYSDGDHEAKSETGVVSIANLEELEKGLRKLGIKKVKPSEKAPNVAVYVLPWRYTEKDINRLLEQSIGKKKRFNHVVMAENVNPTLFVNLDDLMQAVYENVRRLEPTARETLGNMMVEVCAEMICCYAEMCNGRIKEAEGMRHIKKLLNKVKSQAMILSDLKLWNARIYARIGEIVIKIQDILDLQLKEYQK